jgi:NADH-quinone oxidoreductase subunit J
MNVYHAVAEGGFVLFVLSIFCGAFISLRARYLMNALLGLALALLGLAGLFYHLGSPFLSLMQLLINIGAVCVIIAFGIVVGRKPQQEATKHKLSGRNLGLAVVAGLAVAGPLALAVVGAPWRPAAAQSGDFSVRHLGDSLLHEFCLPFELISVVLLVAIVGALIIANIGGEEKT